MKSTRRFVPVVFLLALLVLCATPFAAAQDSASVSPALSPRAQALLPAPPARTYAPAAAVPGAAVPIFRQTGTYSGTCTLVCHGVTHSAWSYP